MIDMPAYLLCALNTNVEFFHYLLIEVLFHQSFMEVYNEMDK